MEKIVSTFSHIRRRLEALLENDFDHKLNVEKEKTRAAFEASRDISLIRGISAGLPEDHIDKVVVLFSRMAMFFDAGVMMENHDGQWKAQATFERGVVDALKTPTKNPIKLPHVAILSVLRTSPKPLLEKLQLQKLDPKKDMQCLLIKISSDFSFLLLSHLPDIWLKEHVENIRQGLQNGIAD